MLKHQLADGKETPVFGVLTNGEIFLFFAIDIEHVVYPSGEIIISKLPKDEHFINEVARMVFVLNCDHFSSVSKSVLTEENIEDPRCIQNLHHTSYC